MELAEALRHRRMVRSFSAEAVVPAVVDELLASAVRAPSAGFSQGWSFVVLEGPDQTRRYWDVTLPGDRSAFPWPGLLRAPVLIVPVADPARYTERYAEADKAAKGLGDGPDAWPVPYWFVDTAFASMILLLGAVDASLGALFFGIFDHEAELCEALGIPSEMRPIGTIALGHPDGGDRPSRSTERPRRTLDEVVHRGGW